MKTTSLLLILGTFFSTTAFAGPGSSTYAKLTSISNKADELVGNGFTSVYSYDRKKFSVQGEILKTKKSFGETDCVYDVIVGIDANIANIRTDELVKDDPSIADDLASLAKNGELLNIISYSWDGLSGDSEYCYINQYDVFGNDGTALYMEFNSTD